MYDIAMSGIDTLSIVIYREDRTIVHTFST